MSKNIAYVDFGGGGHARLDAAHNMLEFFTPRDQGDEGLIQPQYFKLHAPWHLTALADALAPYRTRAQEWDGLVDAVTGFLVRQDTEALTDDGWEDRRALINAVRRLSGDKPIEHLIDQPVLASSEIQEGQ